MGNLRAEATLIGNLVRDVELFSNNTICRITIACQQPSYKDVDGNKIEPQATFVPVWFNIKRYKNVETVQRMFKKANKLMVKATIKQTSTKVDVYENKKKITKNFNGFDFWMNDFVYLS